MFESLRDNMNLAVGGILLTEGISKVFSRTVIEVDDDGNKKYIGDDSFIKLSHDLIDSTKKPYYDQDKLMFIINNLYFMTKYEISRCNFGMTSAQISQFLTTHFGNSALCDIPTFQKFSWLMQKFDFICSDKSENHLKLPDNFCATQNIFNHVRLCRLGLNSIKLDKIIKQKDFENISKDDFRELFRYQKLAYGIELGMDMWNSLEDLNTVLENSNFKEFDLETFCKAVKEFYEFPEFWGAWISDPSTRPCYLRDLLLKKLCKNETSNETSFNLIKVYKLFKSHEKDFICGTIVEWICENVEIDEMIMTDILLDYLTTTQVVYTKSQTMNKVCQKFCWENSYSGNRPKDCQKRDPIYISEFYAWSRVSGLAVVKIVEFISKSEFSDENNPVSYLLNLDLNVIKPDDDRSKRRYHQNSQMHRVKAKLWSILFLIAYLRPDLYTIENVKILLETFQWAQDASVRVIQEWILAIILNSHENEELKFQIYESADKSLSNPNQQRGDANNISSFMIVLLFDALWELNDKFNVDKFRKCVSYCTVWSSYPHFPVRLLAQTILWRIGVEVRDRAVDFGDDFIKMHQFIEKSYIGNQGKHLLKAKKSFSVGELMPKEDISLQVIFDTIPEICGVSPTEKMRYFENDAVFERISKKLKIQLHLPKNSNMLEAVPLTESFNIHDWANIDGGYSNENEIENVQKKIIPDPEGFGISADSRKTVGELIVIASLIDKAENLGGICRTCEALGATRLYVPNLRIVQNKEFKALSMSSHQWMEISECRFDVKNQDYTEIEKLLKFLRNSEGFKIVGLEQTSESEQLGAVNTGFSEKTVILLGAEKTGIPIELLNLLDQCIEIPQAGVTRSLNVHVSAAICMWEYVRQKLLK